MKDLHLLFARATRLQGASGFHPSKPTERAVILSAVKDLHLFFARATRLQGASGFHPSKPTERAVILNTVKDLHLLFARATHMQGASGFDSDQANPTRRHPERSEGPAVALRLHHAPAGRLRFRF